MSKACPEDEIEQRSRQSARTAGEIPRTGPKEATSSLPPVEGLLLRTVFMDVDLPRAPPLLMGMNTLEQGKDARSFTVECASAPALRHYGGTGLDELGTYHELLPPARLIGNAA